MIIGGHYFQAISSLILTKKPSWLSFKGVGIGDGSLLIRLLIRL